MQGRQFLEVARMAVEDSNEEWQRTAAGRTYYALFLEARDALIQWGTRAMPAFQAHAHVRTRFEFAKNHDCQQVGQSLRRLFNLRSQADYELATPFASAYLIDQAIDDAASAIQLLDAIGADASRLAQVVAAIRAVP